MHCYCIHWQQNVVFFRAKNLKEYLVQKISLPNLNGFIVYFLK